MNILNDFLKRKNIYRIIQVAFESSHSCDIIFFFNHVFNCDIDWLFLPNHQVSIFGVIANVYNLQFLILKQKEIDLAKSFTNLLILLSLFDLLYLSNAIGLLGLPEISVWYTNNVYKNIAPIW